jgi:predicted metalloprotease with PDZ domain
MKMNSFALWSFTLFLIFCHPFETLAVRPDHYQVEFDASNPKVVQVYATLQISNSLLYMSPNGPMPERWPQYIHNLKAGTKDGDAITIIKSDSTQWKLKNTVQGQIIQLKYEVHIDHELIDWPGGIDGVAFVRDWGVMASGRSLFIMNGENKKDLEVTIKTPEGWTVSVPWEAKKATAEIYKVPTQEQLQESFLFAGTHEEVPIVREGFTLKFVLGGDAIVANREQYAQMAGSVLDYYIDLMGGIPQPQPGEEFSQVLVLINQSEQVDGEVIGSHISMLINPKADMQQQLVGWFMFAHEFFHLWNGKTLRFEGTQSDWFKEGLTNYYTLKALHQVGFVNEEGIKMILDHLFYQRYVNDSGYGELAPAKAASGFDKDNHWGIVYGGGLFSGICFDMTIRQRSNNQKSLDDVMQYFYQHFGGTEKTISNEEILSRLNEAGQTDFTTFMEQHIMGPLPVPIADHLTYAGVEVDTSNGHLSLIHQPDKTTLQKNIWAGFLGDN